MLVYSLMYSLWGTTWEKIFKRDRKCVYPLSLSIMMLTAFVLPLLHFCERDSGGLFHCGVTTKFIFILTIYISMDGSPGDVSEEPVTKEKRKKGWRMSCGVGKATEGLENEVWRRWSDGKVGEWAVLHLRQNSFSNSSVALPTSQFILQPFFRDSYVTGSSLTSPGEPPMHIYVSYKMFSKYCGRHWQKQGSDWLSQVQFFIPFYCQIPASVLEKVRSGSCLKLFPLDQGSSTFWVRGPIYIFHVILRAAVIADYRIMNLLSIFTKAWAARQVT